MLLGKSYSVEKIKHKNLKFSGNKQQGPTIEHMELYSIAYYKT